MTLTFKNNQTNRRYAQKRFNSFASHFLRLHVAEYIAAVERQSRGAIHYHVVCAFPFDIRTGFDFAACTAANDAARLGNVPEQRRQQHIYFRSANSQLRSWWASVGNSKIKGAAAKFGFGRCETLPILSNGQALARYVGSYVASELGARKLEDKGLRTIRYGLEQRVASIRWQWAAGAGAVWRMGCQVLSLVLGTDNFTGVLGTRWAWNFRNEISAFGRNYVSVLPVVERGVSDEKDIPERIAAAVRLAGIVLGFEAEDAAKAVQ